MTIELDCELKEDSRAEAMQQLITGTSLQAEMSKRPIMRMSETPPGVEFASKDLAEISGTEQWTEQYNTFTEALDNGNVTKLQWK